MHLTINVEDSDLAKPEKLRLMAQALLVLAGEPKPAITDVTLKVGVDTTDAVKDLLKLREELLKRSGATPREGGLMGNRMAGEGPAPVDDKMIYTLNADEDAPPQDDPAAILAAAQGGGAPLDDPAAVLSGAAAQTSTSAPADTTATSTELDSSGLPWDERIHSGSRAKVKDGTWRKRSKLADGVYEQIEAELRIHYPKPAPTPPPPPSGPAGGGSEFAALVQRLHAGFARAEDPVTKDQQVAAMQHFGIAGLEDLSKRPDLFQPFADMLGI